MWFFMENFNNQIYSTPDPSKDNIQKLSRDMKFVAFFIIIYGAISALTLIGALVGIPIIFAGLKLRDASIALQNYLSSNHQSDFDNAIEKQARAFWILKILIIVTIVVYVFFIIVFVLFLLPMFRNIPVSEI